MKCWRRLHRERLHDWRVFDVERVVYETSAASGPPDYSLVGAPDWINVIPPTDDERVVVIRQFRVGLDAHALAVTRNQLLQQPVGLDVLHRLVHRALDFGVRQLMAAVERQQLDEQRGR